MVRGFILLGLAFSFLTVVYCNKGHHGGGHKGPGFKKMFKKHHEKHKLHSTKPGTGIVAEGEQLPNDPIVQSLVKEHAMQIKMRANLDVQSDEDKTELANAPVDALSFIKYTEGGNDIYLIKVIIGNLFIVHVKIGAKKGTDKESTLMIVLPDKEETDKLTKSEFP